MIDFNHKTLIRESEWMRVYKLQNGNTYVYESKFLMDGLHISPATIKKKWPALSPPERLEFASAFSSQPPRNKDDHEILEYLMEVGSEDVWRAIAKLLPFHPSRDRAVKFLLERVRDTHQGRANYYQAIESLGGDSTLSPLRQRHDEYLRLLSKESGSDQFDLWIDYLQCCKTLWALTLDPMFVSELIEKQGSAPLEVRPVVARLLQEIEKMQS